MKSGYTAKPPGSRTPFPVFYKDTQTADKYRCRAPFSMLFLFRMHNGRTALHLLPVTGIVKYRSDCQAYDEPHPQSRSTDLRTEREAVPIGRLMTM